MVIMLLSNQFLSKTAVVAQRLIPHLFAPLFSMKYPLIPHLGPQLFLISQQSWSLVPYPTSTSAWSGQVEQSRGLATPLLQCIKPVKSSKMESGPVSQSASLMIFSSWVIFIYPLILILCFWSLNWHGPLQLLRKGQSLSFISPPLLASQSMALQGQPPLHPKLDLSQSISCCSERVRICGSLLAMKLRLSMFPAVLKVQQLPQLPWSFIGPTTPCCTQFQISGVVDLGLYSGSLVKFCTQLKVGKSGTMRPIIARAYETVRSVNLVQPQRAWSLGSAFMRQITIMFLRQMAKRQYSTILDQQRLPYYWAQDLNWWYFEVSEVWIKVMKSAKINIRGKFLILFDIDLLPLKLIHIQISSSSQKMYYDCMDITVRVCT